MPAPDVSAASLIPRRVLFGNPERISPTISPDGTRIAFLRPYQGILNIWIRSIGETKEKPLTKLRGRGVRYFQWAYDGEHLLYSRDQNGDENYRLYKINVKTGRIKNLTPFAGTQVQLLAAHPKHPTEVLVLMNRPNPKVFDVYRLSLTDGKLELVEKNPGNVSSYIADEDYAIIGRVLTKEGGGSSFDLRLSGLGSWEQVFDWSAKDSVGTSVSGITKDKKYIFLTDSVGVDKSRLVRYDIRSKTFEVLAEDPDSDLGGFLCQAQTGYPLMANFTKDRTEYIVLDPAVADDIDRIQKINYGDFFVASRDWADKRWIVGFTLDTGPTPFYLYDRTTKKSEFLFVNRPSLEKYALAPMEPYSFESSDGLVIHGYMTFPLGSKRENLPTVILVHGGPWARDTWGYQGQVQWLANRGYLVAQVNFRGSTGYGKNFINAADREWGGAMQRDITEAVGWLIKKKYADPKRVAIFGGSFGGYAALCGVTFTPDLYRCAVAAMGPSNLITFLKSIPPQWTVYKNEYYTRIGNPETDRDLLESRSPLFFVDRIKSPVLIAQGANDPRVKRSESEQMVRALKDKGLPCEYLLFPDEGHGFARPANRLKLYAAIEGFLARYLGGRVEV